MGLECFDQVKGIISWVQKILSHIKDDNNLWSKLVKSCNNSEMWDNLVTSHYAMLLSPHEARKPKASLTFKQCCYDLETVHIILTLSYYHTSSNHPFTLKLFIFQDTRNPYTVHLLHSNFKLPNLHPLLIHITLSFSNLNLWFINMSKKGDYSVPYIFDDEDMQTNFHRNFFIRPIASGRSFNMENFTSLSLSISISCF